MSGDIGFTMEELEELYVVFKVRRFLEGEKEMLSHTVQIAK